MQKFDNCELCGDYTLVADYGYNREFICVDCSIKDDKLAEHVSKEMLKRHGQHKVNELMEQVLGEITRN